MAQDRPVSPHIIVFDRDASVQNQTHAVSLRTGMKNEIPLLIFLLLCLKKKQTTSGVVCSAGGNKVHVLLWDEKPLIENLGSGTTDAEAALLGNGDELHMYGSVMDKDLSEILQTLLAKYIKGEALRLYRNEITYVDALDWKAFPKALIVSDGIIQCGPIEDRITEVKELLEMAKR